MVPSAGTGAGVVVGVVGVVGVVLVAVGGVVLWVDVSAVRDGDEGGASTLLVQPATVVKAVRAITAANVVRLGVVVVLITVSLQGWSALVAPPWRRGRRASVRAATHRLTPATHPLLDLTPPGGGPPDRRGR
jgi:hypothetical protein